MSIENISGSTSTKVYAGPGSNSRPLNQQFDGLPIALWGPAQVFNAQSMNSFDHYL